MKVENAEARDAAEIVELFRRGFDEQVRGLLIHGCPGAEHFVADHIRLGPPSPYRYLIVRDRSSLMAAAEFRTSPDTLFLNYIAVHPGAQGKGIARSLLGEAIRWGLGNGLRRLALDVFTSNSSAARLYERMGLKDEAMRYHCTRPLIHGEAGTGWRVNDFPQAESVHARLGFSQLVLEYRGRTVPVGRMGDRYFRVVGWELALDTELHAFLACLSPRGEMLAVVDTPPQAAGWQVVVASRRMSARLEELTP